MLVEYHTCGEVVKTFIWLLTGCWLLAVEVLATVVVLMFDFGVEVDNVTIWVCLGSDVAVVVTTDTVEEPKLLVAVVGTSLMYWTYN